MKYYENRLVLCQFDLAGADKTRFTRYQFGALQAGPHQKHDIVALLQENRERIKFLFCGWAHLWDFPKEMKGVFVNCGGQMIESFRGSVSTIECFKLLVYEPSDERLIFFSHE